MNQIATDITPDFSALDRDLEALRSGAEAWARTSNAERIAVLAEIKDRLLEVAEGWAETAARRKLIPAGSPLAGGTWLMIASNASRRFWRGPSNSASAQPPLPDA